MEQELSVVFYTTNNSDRFMSLNILQFPWKRFLNSSGFAPQKHEIRAIAFIIQVAGLLGIWQMGVHFVLAIYTLLRVIMCFNACGGRCTRYHACFGGGSVSWKMHVFAHNDAWVSEKTVYQKAYIHLQCLYEKGRIKSCKVIQSKDRIRKPVGFWVNATKDRFSHA